MKRIVAFLPVLALGCPSDETGDSNTGASASSSATSGVEESGESSASASVTQGSVSAEGGSTDSSGGGSVDDSSGGSVSMTASASATGDSSGGNDDSGSGGSDSGSGEGGSTGSTSGVVTDSDSDSDTNTTGIDPNCEAPGDLVPCDAQTDDPFEAIGLNCPGNDPNQVIPIFGESFTSADPEAWRVARQLGTYIDPMTNAPLWSPREGEQFLVISSGRINAPNGQGVITMVDADVYDSNGNPDGVQLPAPMSPFDGSNNGAGGTPFVNCDDVGDCSDSLETQWTFGGSDANDMLWFQFEVDVPGGTNGFSFDFAYFSVEFPEWVDTVYNDIFVVWSNSETYTGNLCFVDDQPCTVTALWPIAYDVGAPELAGTGFDGGGFVEGDGGGTGWYNAKASAEPLEQLQLTWAVFDMGDTIYDTLVIIDNWRWDCEGCVPNEVMGCGIDPQ